MRTNVRSGILVLLSLVLVLLSFGCGGGGLPPTTQSTQSSSNLQTDNKSLQSMQTPLMGFASAISGGEVRAINGVPGASVLGAPLELPDGIAAIDFAPGQKSAIVQRTDGSIGVISFAAAEPGPVTPVPGAIAQPDMVVFSPNGTVAVLYSTSLGRLQVLAGLPDKPQLTRDMQSGQFPGAVRVFAVADDGTTLVEGTVNSAVYLLAADGAQLLESVSDLGGIVFRPKSNDALIYDRNGGVLSLMQGVTSSHSSQALASGLTGLEGTIAFQVSGRMAVITSTNANRLWQVNLQTLQAQNLSLPITPEMLKPLRVAGEFLLDWQPGGLAWIVDTNQAKGAVYMVPAAAQAQVAMK